MTTVRTPLPPDGWALYDPSFVPGQRDLMATLVEVLPLRQEVLHIYGEARKTPRLVSWHGDPGATYGYSGTSHTAHGWTPQLLELRERLRPIGVFNSVLVNYYRDGDDSVGFHADNEPELGPDSPDDVLIASISLGGKRRFVLKHTGTKETREFMLGGGDLFVMGGATQKHWVHSVPKTTLPVLPRMNLTFRQVKT